MAILKTDEGLISMDRCPKCGYLVKWVDMKYENGQPVMCSFCVDERPDEKVSKQQKEMELEYIKGRITDYQLIYGDLPSVEKQVKFLMGEGWEPFGFPAFLDRVYQAVVKRGPCNGL